MTLEQWDVLGNWVAGIGTLLAVITSLYFAWSQGKIKLKVVVGERQLITSGEKEMPDVVSIIVTNCSQRPAKITHISWRVGWFGKRHFLQIFNIPGYETLPKMLNEGEEGMFVIPYRLRGTDEDWIISITKSLMGDARIPWLYIQSMKCLVSTSVGQQFKVKVERGLKNAIFNQHKANKKIKRDLGAVVPRRLI